MRGKAAHAFVAEPVRGITPAHAGKSYENGAALDTGAGSPPRMRGKGHALADVGGDERITPAHAGKRERHRAQGALYEDHPRACGEKNTGRC